MNVTSNDSFQYSKKHMESKRFHIQTPNGLAYAQRRNVDRISPKNSTMEVSLVQSSSERKRRRLGLNPSNNVGIFLYIMKQH